MCHTCWYGRDTPKWKAIECSNIITARAFAKRDLEDWANGDISGWLITPFQTFDHLFMVKLKYLNYPLLYDPWFETDEGKQWCEANSLSKVIEQAIAEYKVP